MILYSNHTGSDAFDEKLNLIDKRLFTEQETTEKCLALERNEWLPEEKELIRLHANGKAYFLGFKKEKIEGVTFTQDIKKLETAARQSSFEKTRAKLIWITKLKVRNSTGKDLLIMQASSAIEDLNKAANLLAKRLREWYELHNPEYSQSVEDHEKFCELITSRQRSELLKSIGLSEDKSMGAELKQNDIKAILTLAQELKTLYNTREEQKQYLEGLMKQECPNTQAVAGSLIGAKLITIAGSLKRLSELPASTIQVLGAEKALFRHIKTGARPPKFGVIHSHPLIQNTRKEQQGKTARILADKIAIAAKVDYFKGEYIGDKLAKEAETKAR
ncbi:hypothetical protein HY640_00760 [Candidatus Woesearchaeota archaeon]|nr:hypothetical protein [Candidatus Woesearchaeota archaeon]